MEGIYIYAHAPLDEILQTQNKWKSLNQKALLMEHLGYGAYSTVNDHNLGEQWTIKKFVEQPHSLYGLLLEVKNFAMYLKLEFLTSVS